MPESNELQNIRLLLSHMTAFIELLADETAELVDKFHSQSLTPDGIKNLQETRVCALTEGALSLRQFASTLLGIPDRRGNQEGSK